MFTIKSSLFLKRIFLLFFLASLSNGFSQNKAVDSLQTYTKKDTIRVKLLNAAALKIIESDTDKALQLYKESEQLSEALQYKKGKAYSLLMSGRAYSKKGDYPTSITYFQNSLEVYEDLKIKVSVANCHLNIGRSYYYLTDFPKALEHLKTATELSEQSGKLRVASNALMIIAMIYNTQGDYDKSLEYYKKSIVIDEKLGDKKGLAVTYINLANLYKQQNQPTLALEHYNKSLEIYKQFNDEYGVASNLNNIGTLYQEMENNKAALPNYYKALAIFEKLKKDKEVMGCLSNIGIILMSEKNPKALAIFKKGLRLSQQANEEFAVAFFNNNIGGYYFMIENYDASLPYYEKAVKTYKKIGAQRELSNSYLNISRIYFSRKEYDKALQYAKEGSDIANELKLLSLQTDYSLLFSKIYYALKEYKLAYESGQEHKELNDSLYKKETFDKLAEIKYEYAYKDTLTTAKKSVNTLKKTVAVSELQKKWLIGGFIGLLIVLGFLLALLKIRRVKMQNQQLLLEQKLLITQMNPHFIFNSIQNIRSLINNRQNDEAVNYLGKFSKLTRQILEHSNQNYISLAEELEMLENYLTIQQLLYENKFTFNIHIEENMDTESIFLPPMLAQPYIENAIKHGLSNTTENGKINVHYYLKEEKLYFEVTDNGKGFGTDEKVSNHKSLAMTITKERLTFYTKNKDFVVQTNNVIASDGTIEGAKVAFEVPYIYES